MAKKDIDALIKDWAKIKTDVAQAQAELDVMKKSSQELQDEIIVLMQQLGEDTRRVNDIYVKIRERKQGGRVSYKEGYKLLLNKVNAQIKSIAEEVLEGTRGESWVQKYLVKEASLEESGIVQAAIKLLRKVFNSVRGKLFNVERDIDKLEMEAPTAAMTEADLYIQEADLLIEQAVLHGEPPLDLDDSYFAEADYLVGESNAKAEDKPKESLSVTDIIKLPSPVTEDKVVLNLEAKTGITEAKMPPMDQQKALVSAYADYLSGRDADVRTAQRLYDKFAARLERMQNDYPEIDLHSNKFWESLERAAQKQLDTQVMRGAGRNF